MKIGVADLRETRDRVHPSGIDVHEREGSLRGGGHAARSRRRTSEVKRPMVKVDDSGRTRSHCWALPGSYTLRDSIVARTVVLPRILNDGGILDVQPGPWRQV